MVKSSTSTDYLLVEEWENFRGKSLSDWMKEWMHWIFSSSAKYRGRPGEPLFMRGALEYLYDKETGQRRQMRSFLNKSEDRNGNFLGEYVTSETPIYVNVTTAMYFITENYQGYTLNSMDDCMNVCRTDVSQGTGFYWGVQKDGEGEEPGDMDPIYVETPVQVNVPSDSEFASSFEMPIQPNRVYDGYAAGYIGIIKRLDPGRYCIRVGFRGSRGYLTDSVYQVRVRPDSGFNIFTNIAREKVLRKNKTLPESENEPSPLARIIPPSSSDIPKSGNQAESEKFVPPCPS